MDESKYEIMSLNPEFYLHPKDKDLDKFKWKPNVTSEITYPFNERIIAIVKIKYTLTAVMDEKPKREVLFASISQTFSITKNDNYLLKQKGRTVFNCVKIAESAFQEHLSKNKYPTLIGIGLKPITFDSWSGKKSGGDITFSMN